MIYTFQDPKSGEHVDVEMPMSEAVPFGEEVVVAGRTLVRVPDAGQRAIVSPGVAHVSRALPRWTEGADSYTAKGEPVVGSQATIDRIMKKNPKLHYGEDALAHE